MSKHGWPGYDFSHGVSGFLASLAAAGSTLLNGLVSYWPLNEQSGPRYDVVGSNDLTDNNTVGAVNRGPTGTAAKQVSVNTEWLETAATMQSAFSGDFSVCGWLYNTGVAETNWLMFSGSYGSHYNASLGVYGTNGQLGFYSHVGGDGLSGAAPSTLVGWHFYAAKRVGTVLYASIDGADFTSKDVGGTVQGYADTIAIASMWGAGSPAGYDNTTHGPLGLWSGRGLSNAEVLALFASGNGKRYADLTTAEKVGLVSYWNLDEVSGQRNDSHGTNHLTDNNTVGSVNSGPSGTVAKFVAANTESLSAANPALHFTSDFTFSTWVNVREASTNQFILTRDNSSTVREYLLYFPGSDNTAIDWHVWQADGGLVSTAQLTGLPVGGWYNVICGYSSATGKTFIYLNNGSVVEGGSVVGGLTAGGSVPFALHAQNGSPGGMEQGLTGAWSRVLTAGERTSLFAQGNGLKYTDLPAGLLTGLVSYWNLDEASGTRVDSHGSNDLTDNNTVGSVINAGDAMDGAAASFVAANSESLYKASAADLSFGDADFTVAAWFKSTTLDQSVYAPIAAHLDYGTAQNWDMLYYPPTQTLLTRLWDGGSTVVSVSTTGVTAGAWHLAIMHFDSVAGKLFVTVDGVTDAGTAVSSAPTEAVGAMWIGGFGSNAGVSQQEFDGQIDEVAIWSRVLTSDERAELYNAGAGKYYPFTT